LDWIAALHDWPGAALMRRSGPAHAAVSAAHLLGIALTLGAALPMDLRLVGFFGRVPLAAIVPFLARIAAKGVMLAAVTGLALVSVNPADYLADPAFRAKLYLLSAAFFLIAARHANPAWAALPHGSRATPSLRVTAAASALIWLAILGAGRWTGLA
jgi:hypothetical protein